jgi:hypothetical protein
VILLAQGDVSLVETLRPPMEPGGRANQIGTSLQHHTASGLGVLEILDGGKMPIHQHSIGERPQMSTGWSAGEYGGKKRRWRWSGTRKRWVLCHPARSRTRTICLVGLASTACANAASSASKSGIVTLVANERWSDPRQDGQSVPGSASRSGVGQEPAGVVHPDSRLCAGWASSQCDRT